MNGNPYTTTYIGSTGIYPIQDYINSNITNTSNYVLNTSNILELHSSNSSNFLQTQITGTCNLVYKDNDCNTILRISAQNIYYPISGNPVEMRFQNVENKYITKITQTGELFVYHPSAPIPAGYGPGWWSVENKIANCITDGQGLRFDVTNLQAATGATAITDATTASGAVAGAVAGVASATATTATAGTAIAGGDYGSVALGLAGGALFSVLGYLSYQAQVESNLSNNGFTTQATQVHSSINTANLLIASNISNICIATGFLNCNIKKLQTIPNLNTYDITYNGVNISNVFLKQAGGTLTGSLIAPNLTTATSFIYQGNELSSTLGNYLLKAGGTMTGRIIVNYATYADPSPGAVGGNGDRLIINPGSGSIYGSSLGVNTSSFWFSTASGNSFNWFIGGVNNMSLTSAGRLIASNITTTTSFIYQGTELATTL